MALKRVVRCRVNERPARFDWMIEQAGTTVAYLSTDILFNNYGMSIRKIGNLNAFMQEEKRKWNDDEKTTDQLIFEATKDKPYIMENVRKVPFSQLLKIAGSRPGDRVKDVRLKPALQCGLALMMCWVDAVLKDHYRMSAELREAFMICMCNQDDEEYPDGDIKLWCRGDISNESIRQQIIKETGWDITNGVKVLG